MRTLVLNSDNPIVPIGGVAEVIRAIMKFWNYDGLNDNLDVISFGGEDFYMDESKLIHHKVVRYEPVNNIQYQTYRSLFIQANLFRTALEFEKPDIVLATDWNCAIVGKQLALHYGVPYIFWSHLSPLSYCIPDSQGHIKVEASVEMQALDLADGVLHVSENYANKFQFKPFLFKTHVIHNGIDLDDFKYKEDKSPYKHTDRFNLLYLGRPVRQKGIPWLLEAKLPKNVILNFALADNRGLAALGQTNLCSELCNQNPEQYQFLGDIRGTVKSNYLNWADAVIIPSITEPFGIVGLEALASKTLVISTLVEGLGNYMDSSFVIKIDKESSEAITDGIVRACKLGKVDKHTMIETGYEVAQNHDWRQKVIEIKNYLKEYII